ncbi:hypothetical protein EDB81DRAFT_196939 [Dactylonectria macrodidyma]|uniref:LYR motif-containing protein Cup1-like N-terminal domain-containing protein n=1 Tax=Dactylonectria macrodidyma TaxID=307937 RepID=A0A9P9FRN0_9HYPO|nr:hypothetical protein EDB81DRAFT_196939 [Dactylonectria macrodidyma]
MPRPQAAIPQFLPPLHLYRNILRECSYLPPSFRTPIVGTIRNHFRKNQIDDPRPKKHLARAYQVLGRLRLANSGDRNMMQKFMHEAYGRAGSRRRVLMSKLVLADKSPRKASRVAGPHDSDTLEALLTAADYEELEGLAKPDDWSDERERPDITSGDDRPYKRKFHHGYDKPRLLRLLSSQRANEEANPLISLHGEIKRLDENKYVPEKNIWGKPPVRDLVETKRAKWWAKMAAKIMPPLEKDEWEMLGQLSVGAQDNDKKWRIPERRPLAKLLHEEDKSRSLDWDWEGYASLDAVHVEDRKSLKRNRRTGERDTGPYQAQTVQRPITARWYKRAYTRIWQITPLMEQDPLTNKERISWGTQKSSLRRARKSQLDLFEGVDHRGIKLPDSSHNGS